MRGKPGSEHPPHERAQGGGEGWAVLAWTSPPHPAHMLGPHLKHRLPGGQGSLSEPQGGSSLHLSSPVSCAPSRPGWWGSPELHLPGGGGSGVKGHRVTGEKEAEPGPDPSPAPRAASRKPDLLPGQELRPEATPMRPAPGSRRPGQAGLPGPPSTRGPRPPWGLSLSLGNRIREAGQRRDGRSQLPPPRGRAGPGAGGRQVRTPSRWPCWAPPPPGSPPRPEGNGACMWPPRGLCPQQGARPGPPLPIG